MNELGNTPADKDYRPSGISRAEEAAGKIHNRALLEAEKYAASHARSIVEEVAYGRGFKTGFIEGYEQAEKDLALTWEDMKTIFQIITTSDWYDFEINGMLWSKEFYEEVLTRFKKYKEAKNERT